MTESRRISTIDAEKSEKWGESNAKPMPGCCVVVHGRGGIRVLTVTGQNLRIFA
ncbi:MAG: hypothetical protein ACYSWZ_22510 [Planctomycetota bacterium]